MEKLQQIPAGEEKSQGVVIPNYELMKKRTAGKRAAVPSKEITECVQHAKGYINDVITKNPDLTIWELTEKLGITTLNPEPGSAKLPYFAIQKLLDSQKRIGQLTEKDIEFLSKATYYHLYILRPKVESISKEEIWSVKKKYEIGTNEITQTDPKIIIFGLLFDFEKNIILNAEDKYVLTENGRKYVEENALGERGKQNIQKSLKTAYDIIEDIIWKRYGRKTCRKSIYRIMVRFSQELQINSITNEGETPTEINKRRRDKIVNCYYNREENPKEYKRLVNIIEQLVGTALIRELGAVQREGKLKPKEVKECKEMINKLRKIVECKDSIIKLETELAKGALKPEGVKECEKIIKYAEDALEGGAIIRKLKAELAEGALKPKEIEECKQMIDDILKVLDTIDKKASEVDPRMLESQVRDDLQGGYDDTRKRRMPNSYEELSLDDDIRFYDKKFFADPKEHVVNSEDRIPIIPKLSYNTQSPAFQENTGYGEYYGNTHHNPIPQNNRAAPAENPTPNPEAARSSEINEILEKYFKELDDLAASRVASRNI